MSEAEGRLTIARLHIGTALERVRKALEASTKIGHEHPVGQMVFHYTETDVISSLDEALRSVQAALHYAREARDAKDSLVSRMRRGELLGGSAKGGAA